MKATKALTSATLTTLSETKVLIIMTCASMTVTESSGAVTEASITAIKALDFCNQNFETYDSGFETRN